MHNFAKKILAIDLEKYQQLKNELNPAQLVAVSKMQPVAALQRLYAFGQRAFGENYVQELIEKRAALPNDIEWHFIGHLQTNKVKLVVPFVHLIQAVDSEKLLLEINKQSAKINRVTNCLLQVHIAEEETKFGFDYNELALLSKKLISQPKLCPFINICGLMGMASFSEDEEKIDKEFKRLFDLYEQLKTQFSSFNTLSMGMSGDYKLAVANGSNMVRIGSLLFGNRG